MPLYNYRCPTCGKSEEKFLRIAELNNSPLCSCKAGLMVRQLPERISVLADFPSYSCPITGVEIRGRRAHEENLKRHNCRILEAGETAAYVKRQKAEEEKFISAVGESAVKEVLAMPAEKREQLGRCLESSEVSVERR